MENKDGIMKTYLKTVELRWVQFLLAFFGGGGKYIDDAAPVLISVVVICADIWGEGEG
jgi:hypothetical protein